MSIQPTNKAFLHSQVAPVSAPRVVGDLTRSPEKDDTGAFSRILGEMVTGASALSQGLQGNEPLSKEKVLQLVQWMNIKMNESLLRSVEGDGSDASYRWKFDSLLPPPAEEMTVVEDIAQPQMNQALPKVIPTSAAGREYEEIIQKAAAAYDVDPDLIRGVIQVESNFNASARSPKGAMGLMQLMPGTARELGVNDPYDPQANIMGGTRYLKKLLNRYDGDVSLALAAYNWGMGNLENHRNWMPQETRNYVSRITSLYNRNDQGAS
jgi:hypothetical protein